MDTQETIVPAIVEFDRNNHCSDCQKFRAKHTLRQRLIVHYKHVSRNRFALEITLIVIVKALILYGFWFAFFSKPLAKHMLVPPMQMEQHMIDGTDTLSNTNTSSNQFSSEVSHDSH